MLATAPRAIGANETSEEVERDLAHIGAALLVDTIDAVARGHAPETPQDDTAATYAHRLTKEDGAIDWTRRSLDLHNQIRGLHPWPHAFSFLSGRRLILRRSEPEETRAPGAPGTLVEAAGDRVVVATGGGHLRLTELQPEGKRPMTARDFLAGHPVKAGDRFTVAP